MWSWKLLDITQVFSLTPSVPTLWTQTGLVLNMNGCEKSMGSKIYKIVWKPCGIKINKNEKAKFFTAWLALLSIFGQGLSVCVCVWSCVCVVTALALEGGARAVAWVANIGEGDSPWIYENENFLSEKNYSRLRADLLSIQSLLPRYSPHPIPSLTFLVTFFRPLTSNRNVSIMLYFQISHTFW